MTDNAIQTIDRLCATLSRARLTVREVADSLGTIVQDQGGHLAVTVQPRDPAFTRAVIARDSQTGEPAHVELSLAAAIAVAALRQAFGELTVVPVARAGKPTGIIFRVDHAGQPYTCAILADVQPGQRDIAQSMVSALTVRRDVRLK
jgi:hypothetical protein